MRTNVRYMSTDNYIFPNIDLRNQSKSTGQLVILWDVLGSGFHLLSDLLKTHSNLKTVQFSCSHCPCWYSIDFKKSWCSSSVSSYSVNYYKSHWKYYFHILLPRFLFIFAIALWNPFSRDSGFLVNWWHWVWELTQIWKLGEWFWYFIWIKATLCLPILDFLCYINHEIL